MGHTYRQFEGLSVLAHISFPLLHYMVKLFLNNDTKPNPIEKCRDTVGPRKSQQTFFSRILHEQITRKARIVFEYSEASRHLYFVFAFPLSVEI